MTHIQLVLGHTEGAPIVALETLCGLDLRVGQFAIPYAHASDEPIPGASGEDTRCRECWKIWRMTRAELG